MWNKTPTPTSTSTMTLVEVSNTLEIPWHCHWTIGPNHIETRLEKSAGTIADPTKIDYSSLQTVMRNMTSKGTVKT